MRLISRILTLAVMVGAMAVLHGDILAQQQQSCDSIVEKLDDAIKICELINEGWACYGNEDTAAVPEDDRFYKPGDRQPLEEIRSIVTKPDVGAALMYFFTRGKTDPVTVILYGGAETSPDGRGYILQMSDNGEICEDSPPGMVAFTESGQRGVITVNGVTIELRSVAFLTMANPDTMIIANVQRSVTARAVGERPRPIDVGKQLEVSGISEGEPVFAEALVSSDYADSPVVAFLAGALGQVGDPNTSLNPLIPACGGEIRIGQSVPDEIHTPGQECLYTFCPNPEDTVTISVEAVDQSPLDPYVDLRAADLTLVAGNNNRSGTDKDSLICNWPVSPTSCDQTIVVRSNRNESAGRFRLTLDGETGCTTPGCFCKVTTYLRLRTGPGTQYPQVRRPLQPGSIVEPLACTENREWYYVSVADFNVTGWFRADPDYVDCEPCIECNVPTPGISVSVSPNPSESVESGGTVVFNVTVRNTGESSLTITSLSNNLLGSSSNKAPSSDTCGDLIKQSLAAGEAKPCSITISGVTGDFLSDTVAATAEDRYGIKVGNNGDAAVKISTCKAPDIQLMAQPSVYLIQDRCGVAEFDLSVINQSTEPITITSMTLDGAPIGGDSQFTGQCPVAQPIKAGEAFSRCPLRVPLIGPVCNNPGQETVHAIVVMAKAASCDKSGSARVLIGVRFEENPPPPPTPVCPKCGPHPAP